MKRTVTIITLLTLSSCVCSDSDLARKAEDSCKGLRNSDEYAECIMDSYIELFCSRHPKHSSCKIIKEEIKNELR